ncbi:MAG: hemerythrin domain-containing protein [Actinomycetota bacterium]|nr:hemerythrin domain-containing protein [Actinomycetota bacterium]
MTHSSSSNDRLTAFGNQLIDGHRWLRAQLTELSNDLAAGGSHADGPRDLRAHCLAFCSALGQHHSAEDAGAFPLLSNDFPELRPMLDKLTEDPGWSPTFCQVGADRLTGVRRIRGEVDGLSAILKSHFTFEERQLVGLLNTLSIHHRPTDTAGISGRSADPSRSPANDRWQHGQQAANSEGRGANAQRSVRWQLLSQGNRSSRPAWFLGGWPTRSLW